MCASTETPEFEKDGTLAQKLTWVLFCATCLQLVFFKSYVAVIPGVKADVFGGVLCAFTFAACLVTADRRRISFSWIEVLISLALLVLIIISGALSSTPWSSSVIGLVLAATGLGGYWCARLLLNSRSRQRGLSWLCLVALGLYAILGLWGYQFHGSIEYLIDDPHETANLIILLSIGPLAFLVQPSILRKVIAAAVLVPSAVLLYFCGISGVEAGVLIPMAAAVPVAFIGSVRSRNRAAMFAVLLVMTAVTSHYVVYVSDASFSARAYQADRIEYYPFSAHIAKQAPFFGIGLRTPREEYLSDYQIRHPYHTKDQFSEKVSRLKVCQDQFLTFMVGLGIPFVVLYLSALITLLTRLVRSALRPGENAFIPPMVLLAPICGGLLYLLVMDFLLLAQISWSFHILLGLVPAVASAKTRNDQPSNWRAASIVTCLAAIALGTFVGTHPAFRPNRLPSFQQVFEHLRLVPAIGPLLDRPPAPTAEEAEQPLKDGHLIVTIKGYEGRPQKWALMCILETSPSMAKKAGLWVPDRLLTATQFVKELARSLPIGNAVAVRDFGEVGPLRRRDREIPFRASRVLIHWTFTPMEGLVFPDRAHSSLDEDDLCAAAEVALQHDFLLVENNLTPRVVLFTDGTGCSIPALADKFAVMAVGGRPVVLDIVGMGIMDEALAASYRQAIAKTFGIFLDVRTPHDFLRLMSEYVDTLSRPIVQPLVISRDNQEYRVLPGQPVTLPPGSYAVTIPEVPGLAASNRRIKDVKVDPGGSTSLNLSIEQGQLRLND